MSDPVFNSQTQHYYERILPNYTTTDIFAEARLLSELRSYRGLYGYLATITSDIENTTVASLVPLEMGAFIGGSDDEVNGVWRWISGPEKGSLIGSSNSSYTNWYPGEPSNNGFGGTGPSSEDALAISSDPVKWKGRWWDTSDFFRADLAGLGFGAIVVEYGGLPATYAITPSATSVNEGSSVTFTIDTKNVEWGKTISYSISGISSSDLESGSLTGTAVVSQKGNDGVATVTVALKADVMTEGTEQLSISVGSTSSTVSVFDYSQPNPAYNSFTGHYYEGVITQSTVIQNVLTAGTWDDAKAAAEKRSYRGLYGYLVTIGSESENSTATAAAVSASPIVLSWFYTGGSDRAQEGVFRWETGPEAGTVFGYTNWWNLPIGSGPEPTSPRMTGEGGDQDAVVLDTGRPTGGYGGYPYTAWTGKWWDEPDGSLVQAFTFGEMYKGYLVEYGGLPATYAITSSATSVNEGSSVTFTIDTKNVEWGKTISYSISGISASDLESGSLTGTAVVSQKGNDGVATVTVALKADQAIEGTEALILSIGTTSSAVAVIDVPPTPTLRLESSATTVDEGSSVLFTWITSGVPTGSQYSYSISGISSADLAAGSLSGYVTTSSSGVAVLEVQLKADRTTEGVETINLTSSGLSKSVSVIDSSKYTQLSSLSTAAPGEIVEVGKHDPILQAYVEDWTKLTAGSLEKFNVNGRGRGDNVIRAINVMTILDDPNDGRQIDPKRLGFWIEQIEEGVLAKGDTIMHDIVSGFVYGREFSDLATTRMDTNGDGVSDISYTRAAVQVLYRNVLGRSWSDITNDPGLNFLVGEIEANRQTIVDVAEKICFGAEAINSAVSIVGTQNLTFVAFGDGFGG